MSTTPYLYEPQANQLVVAGLTSWTNAAGDLQSYVQNSQAKSSSTQLQSVLNTQVATTLSAQQALQAQVNASATLQESTNANKYIAQVLDKQQQAIYTQRDSVRQQQFKLREELMHAQYLQNYYKTATNVLIVTMVVVLVLMIPAALWRVGRMSPASFWSIVLVMILLYLCFVVYVTSLTARRHPDAWYQIDWGVPSDMKKKLTQQSSSCAS